MAIKQIPENKRSQYPSNSKASKQNNSTPQVKPIITGGITRKKKPMGRRFATLFSGDGAINLGASIVEDVVIPGVKNVVYDVADNTVSVLLGVVSMGLFGEAINRKSRRGSRSSSGVVTQYGSMHTGTDKKSRNISARIRNNHEFDEIYFTHRHEANDVLEAMANILDKYGQVSVGSFYDLMDERATSSDRKHGWTKLGDAKVTSDRQGWYLYLPPTEPLM